MDLTKATFYTLLLVGFVAATCLVLYWFKPKRTNPIFYLEGNIGAGKSTLATALATAGDYRVQKEPVAEWQNTKGYNFLSLLGKDRDKWMYVFQTLVLATLAKRIKGTENPCAGKPCVLERSARCAMKVFARYGHQEGFLRNEEMAVLELLHETLEEKSEAVYIYVRTPPEESHRRTAMRGRTEENGLTREYFVRLHNLMDEWLLQDETAPVIVVDGLLSPTELLLEVDKAIKRHLLLRR